jgi:hypothetical protein
MEIKVAPEDINTMLADAVLKSAIGKELHQVILSKLNDYTFKRAIEETVISVVRNIAIDMVHENEEVKTRIKEEVAKYMEGGAMKDIIAKIGDKITVANY